MRIVLGMLALVLAASTSAGKKQDLPEPIAFNASAKAVIDSTGKPSKVEASEKLPDVMRDFIERQVATWRFSPAMVDGVARGGVTYVSLGGCAVPIDGGYRMAINYKGNGPGYPNGATRQAPMRYPMDAARLGEQGSWTLDYYVEPDGATTLISVTPLLARQGGKKHLEPALREWVKQMRYLPEELDGKTVRTRISMPISFSVERASSRKRIAREIQEQTNATPECAAVMDEDSSQHPVVMDPLFKRIDAG